MKSFQLVFVLLLLVVSSALPQVQWNPDAMILFKRVGDPVLSADGRLVAYTVSSPMMEGEKSEFLSQIWVATTDGKQNSQFTFRDKSCSSPRFSPDGEYLAFLSPRLTDSKNQVWIMRVRGGEAERLTDAKSGVNDFQWSPDGKKIAFRMTNSPTDEEEKETKEKRDWKVVDKDFQYAHLYTIEIARGNKEHKVKRLTAGDLHVTSFDWSPDGGTIVFSHQANPSDDTWPTTDISTVSSDSSAISSLVTWKGGDLDPRYSPDGKSIAFVSDGGEPRWAFQNDIYTVSVVGGTPKKFAETKDRVPAILDWSPDGKFIFYFETERTSGRLWKLTVDGGLPTPITTGNGSYTSPSISADGKTAVWVFQNFELPPDVYASPLRSFKPLKLSNVNPDFVDHPMGKSELLTWKSNDGREIEGILTYPVLYDKGRRYPLILNIHGGPTGIFTQSFTGAGSVYPIQAFAQEGYLVLRPNPRGSRGYGKEFRFANYNDWGLGDYDDIIAGVEKVVQMGIAHADSLVVCGWSYGGYMTSFVVTKTNRFKAASVGAGVTNLMSFVGTSDIPGFLPDYFGGEYWNRIDTFMKHSAMFQVKNISVPTQIIHGEQDVRVPLSQGQELYVALKRLGIRTEMIVYPRTPHGPQEPKFIADIGKRIIAWFNTSLGRRGASAK